LYVDKGVSEVKTQAQLHLNGRHWRLQSSTTQLHATVRQTWDDITSLPCGIQILSTAKESVAALCKVFATFAEVWGISSSDSGAQRTTIAEH
jgi:hypothetical protein